MHFNNDAIVMIVLEARRTRYMSRQIFALLFFKREGAILEEITYK